MDAPEPCPRVKLLAAVALCMLLAGCTDPAEPEAPSPAPSSPTPPAASTTPATFGPLSCDALREGAFSRNAPVVPAMRGEPMDVARRFAESFGDNWTGDEPTDPTPGAWKWATRGGEVRYSADPFRGGDTFTLAYSTPRGGAFTRDTVAAALQTLGVPPEGLSWSVEPDGRGVVTQSFDGHPLWELRVSWLPGQGDPAPYGRWASVSATPLRDLSRAETPLSPEEAVRIADAWDRCDMDAGGSAEEAGYARLGEPTASGLAVMGDSLVRLVVIQYAEPRPSHCGLVRTVGIDAATGAVHGLLPFGCD